MLTPGDRTYYGDGITRITDPFWLCICPSGHKMWSCTYEKTCPACGKKLALCVPADQYKKEAASGN